MRKVNLFLVLVTLTATGLTAVSAHAPSGAIFTTVVDGTEVNKNIYQYKEDVYLDGGPGVGAPATAAGLEDGIYVFQVTDPSGKKLLSMDAAKCRRFEVAGGVIVEVVAADECEHATGVDIDHDATTVQLMPYLDTPNHGGEYKAWVVTEGDYLDGCVELGEDNGLDVVDCGYIPGNDHGFVSAHSKTDNFKVRVTRNHHEIDTRFMDFNTVGFPLLDGLKLTWSDPLGASNVKWSYYAPQILVDHFAHVEAVESGVHRITVLDQPGCKVVKVKLGYKDLLNGPGTIEVQVRPNDKESTKYVYVYCQVAGGIVPTVNP